MGDVAFRCPSEAFGAMGTDERRRFCAACQREVHNLSAMTRTEALAFVKGEGATACVSYDARPDGSVVHRASAASLRLRGRLVSAGVLLATATVAQAEPPARVDATESTPDTSKKPAPAEPEGKPPAVSPSHKPPAHAPEHPPPVQKRGKFSGTPD